MSFIQEPAYVIALLLLLVVIAEWLAKRSFFRHIGSVLLVIILAAILANLKIIPSSHNAPPLYDGIFQYAAPLGIFFLLLGVKLKDLRLAGLPMLIMFVAGSCATVAGVIIGYKIFAPQNHQVQMAHAVAGMYTGTYIGGSANLNAIALEYGVQKEGTLYAAINAVDNIITTIWLFLTMFLPPILFRLFPRKKSTPPGAKGSSADEIKSILSGMDEPINIMGVSILLFLAFSTLFISNMITKYIPQIPSILVLTTIALIMAQVPFVQKIKGTKLLGLLLIMMFLAVIGALCDIHALMNSGEVAGILLAWVTAIVFIHGLLIFIIGGIFKQDWDMVSIASNANIGGSTSAPVCAASLGRSDLQLPALLAGSVGNAIGTYLGILVAEFLK